MNSTSSASQISRELPALYAYVPLDAQPFVVLFTDISKGVVVWSQDKDRPLGFQSDTFLDFTDTKVWRRLPKGETITLEN